MHLIKNNMSQRKSNKRLPGAGKKNRTKKTKKGNAGLDNRIIEFIQKKAKSGIKPDRLYTHFGKYYSGDKIQAALDRLTELQKLEFSPTGKYRIWKEVKKNDKLVQGRVDLAKSGVGYVIVEGWDNDIFIPRNAVGFALSGDMVTVEIKKTSGSKTEGKIISVDQRSQEEFICHFQPANGFGFAVPTNSKIPFDFFIPESYAKECESGDLILVHVINWDDAGKNPVGRLVEKLTGLSDNEIEMRSILLENGFNSTFPKKVMLEAKAIPEQLDKAEIKQRLDYRRETTFTIDPEDAKDFDDAISIKKLEDGKMQIGVHIADVSHYVQPGSAMDEEAKLRATSVYLPDRVCPMLPEKISNELCSLRPNEDKYVFSVYFDYSAKMKFINFKFAKSVIHSNRRFTYEEVQDVLETGEGDFAEELKYLDTLAKKLREKRTENGSINFETEEVRFKLDKNAVPIDVYVKERKDAHLLVEDFMLLANTTVAKYLSSIAESRKSFKSVYRVHDKPSMEKLQQLGNVAKRFGYNVTFNDEDSVRDTLNSMMMMLKNKPHMEVLSRMAIRTMAKAEYTTTNIGHYGLAFDHYTHFTSPIRRYPDVLIHRLLEERIIKSKQSTYTNQELEELCAQSSRMERGAQKCERSAIKYKQVEYLQGKEGQEFKGIISGVIQKGFFVELDHNKCEGFVGIDQFNEIMNYEEEEVALVGKKTKTKYQIGDRIRVTLFKTDLREKRVEFDFEEKLDPISAEKE